MAWYYGTFVCGHGDALKCELNTNKYKIKDWLDGKDDKNDI
jgi:hypothetical protein